MGDEEAWSISCNDYLHHPWIPDPDSDEDVGFVDDYFNCYCHIPNKLRPDDAAFQQRLGDAQVRYPNPKSDIYPEHAKDTLAKYVLGKLVFFSPLSWNELRQACNAANDPGLYVSAIKRTAYFVSKIYNKDSLFIEGSEIPFEEQFVICMEALPQREKTCSLYEAAKLFDRLNPNRAIYSGRNLEEMLTHYRRKIPTKSVGDDQDQISNEIIQVVREMDESSLPSLEVNRVEVNRHTRFLTKFLKTKSKRAIHELIFEVMASFKDDAIKRMEEDHEIFELMFSLLLGLSNDIWGMLQGHLWRVITPLLDLYPFNPCCSYISVEIIDIVEVAEIRRMALGCLYISRSHLIWAFYELGYGLPLNIRDAIKIPSIDKPVPPSLTYVAAKKLADCCGSAMHLEHFLYAVIYLEVMDFEGKQGDEVVADFKYFTVYRTAKQERQRKLEQESSLAKQPKINPPSIASY